VTAHPDWPPLPLDAWRPTYETLHLWTQVVGKVSLALAPMVNHWWQVALRVDARGLATPALPYDRGVVALRFDFVDHALRVETSEGAARAVALAPRSVADFHRELTATLREVGVDARITRRPVELPEVIPFDEDETHAAYDPDAARRCWLALVQAARVLERFRGEFVGKCSPVHFWWGSFDLACTRFSGRRAPPHPGGIPNLADRVAREAYSHECISAGWWPGGGAVGEPAFYAYAYPEPAGCPEAPIRPAAGFYHGQLREWVLPYEAARAAPDPDAVVLDFLRSTYDAAARLGGWDRAALAHAPPA
jgi:hypothetical protein